MRVLIEGRLFAEAAWKSSLIRLFDMALEGRHRVFPDPINATEFERWLDERDSDLQDEIRFAIESSLDLESRRPAQCELRVTTTARPRWTESTELPLDEALQILGESLSVVVENQRNDSSFLLAVADIHQKKVLCTALDKGWLRFDHGGGIQEMTETPLAISVFHDFSDPSYGRMSRGWSSWKACLDQLPLAVSSCGGRESRSPRMNV